MSIGNEKLQMNDCLTNNEDIVPESETLAISQ